MNEKTYIINLRDFTDGSGNPYGTTRGRKAHAQLLECIANLVGIKTIGISLKYIDGADVSFLRESLIFTFKQYSKKISFYICDLADEDIIANLEGAAISGDFRVTCWVNDNCRFVGPEPSPSSLPLLNVVLSNRSVTTTQVAQALEMSVQNASTRLKRLSEEGFITRVEMSAGSGGKEFVYKVIGNSA
ncbi:MarR family transcriptional regulator [Pseudomonas tremae]|uniref:MarR family transcriptional regulator n=2 Tax=Pseudomonas tremae TaxID=200454 RepID=UPI001F48A514|nr:helix-turn-helix domain-containing protein [Pseudomonas tremae]MCF5802352.1 winged helix-turn-helix transcriptional regulator [Pseudomonas tremae]